jgi:hypothetical protein
LNSPDKQTSSKDIWSGDFHSSPIHSYTCIEVISGALAITIWTLAGYNFKITWFWDLSLYNVWKVLWMIWLFLQMNTLPCLRYICSGLTSRVKGV